MESRIKPKLRIRGEGIIDRVDGCGRIMEERRERDLEDLLK